MKARILALAFGSAAALAAMPANAVPTVELALAIDGSGSIGAGDFELQKDAYVNALSNPAIMPQDGSVAIGVWLFSTGVSNVFPMTTIDDTNIDALTAAIDAMAQPGGLTNISGAISAAASALLAFNGDGTDPIREVVDVSTDGFQTVPGDPDQAALDAIADGIDAVNCLGVGPGADCGFIAGTDSFSRTVASFADFETALEDKLEAEVGPPPPPTEVSEPPFIALAALLFGLLIGARRRAG